MKYILLLLIPCVCFSQTVKYGNNVVKYNNFVVKSSNITTVPSYDFYVIFGTSNCGRSRAGCFTGGQCLDADSAHWAGLKPNTYIYNQIDSFAWQQLNTGGNTMLYNLAHADEFGFESSFASKLAAYQNKKVYVFKLGVGSSKLAVHWMPTQTNYVLLTNGIDSCFRDAQEQGIKLKFKGIIEMLGENDALDSIPSYNFKYNIDTLNTNLLSYIATKAIQYNHLFERDYKIVMNRILNTPTDEPYMEIVRSQIEEYCNELGNQAIMNDTDEWGTPLNTHYGATGSIGIGIDLFNLLK